MNWPGLFLAIAIVTGIAELLIGLYVLMQVDCKSSERWLKVLFIILLISAALARGLS